MTRRKLSTSALWHSWSARLLWLLLILPDALRESGLGNDLPAWTVRGLTVAALLAKAWQNGEPKP